MGSAERRRLRVAVMAELLADLAKGRLLSALRSASAARLTTAPGPLAPEAGAAADMSVEGMKGAEEAKVENRKRKGKLNILNFCGKEEGEKKREKKTQKKGW